MNTTATGQISKIDKEIGNLLEIEQNINAVIREFRNAKKKLCLLLAEIKMQKLYKQIDKQSFRKYVLSRRLKISYNTALEYAAIGEVLVKYESQLKEANFSEDDGLKKLLLLEKALSKHEPAEVFKRIKDDSFKAFEKFSKPARAGIIPDSLKPENQDSPRKQGKEDSGNGQWIFEENGKLYMETRADGAELLTFNKRLLADEKLAAEYKLFMTNMIVAAMDYFKENRKKKGVCKI